MNDASLITGFERHFGRAPVIVAAAPGRVNLIGEHVDYNDGLVLPVAIDRTVRVAAAPNDTMRLRVRSLDFRASSDVSIAAGDIPRDAAQPWADYVRGVAAVLLPDAREPSGVDLCITGDVPRAAGLSSSAALEVAVAGALRALWRIDIDNRELALRAQRAENGFVGVECGIMDQFAAALAVEGHALLIDCRSLDVEPVPLPLDGVALAVVDSAVPRRLEASAYNARRRECDAALDALRRALPAPPRSWRDVSARDLEAAALPEVLLHRARHVVTEIERVALAADAVRAGDLPRLGALMHASHASLRDDYDVSSPQLDLLVELAQAQPYVLGARLTGAGFGGCTVSLVRHDALRDFEDAVVRRYRAQTGLDATLYVCRPSRGLRVRTLDG